MSGQNFYTVLGVKRNADLVQIRDAYVRRIKDTHPDIEPRGCYPRPSIQDLQKAYACLRDAKSRSVHDAELLSREVAYNARLRRIQRGIIAKDIQRRQCSRGERASGTALRSRRWKIMLFMPIAAFTVVKLFRLL